MPKSSILTSIVKNKFTQKTSKQGLYLLIALISVFSLTLMSMPIKSFAAPLQLIVDDVADLQYDPFTSNATGLNGTSKKTLRWAIEQANRTCDGNPANAPKITFNYADMKINGAAMTAASDTVTPVPAGGSGDKVGFYEVDNNPGEPGVDRVYRLALNSYLPDLTCPGTIIEGSDNSPNLNVIGSGNDVGYRSSLQSINKISRPAIEIMPKSNYVGQIDARATASTSAGDKLKGVKRCGLMLRGNNQEVNAIAIFGFGGGQINDGNICVSAYSNGDSYVKPDFSVSNSNISLTKYFPQVNAAGVAVNGGYIIDMATSGTTSANITVAAAYDMIASNTTGVPSAIPGGDTAAHLASLGAGASNTLKYANIYSGLTKGPCNATPDETTILNTNLVPFSGELRCATTYTTDRLQNTTGVKIQYSISGATADLKDPTGTFTTNVYDTTKAIAVRELLYHSQGSGIHIMTSDDGTVLNNILLFNGGAPEKIAPNGSQAGIVFDQAGYTNKKPSTDPAQNLNAEGWTVALNEIYLNINNDRGYGGHGVFTNLSMNGSPADPKRTRFENNDVYQNGGAGFRTFVPSVDIVGNTIYQNGKHDSTPSATESTVIFGDRASNSPTFTPLVSSFKHGIYFECGDGWVYQNVIHDNPGSGVAMPGGNMQCANGGEPVSGGAVISENSIYNNGLLAIDRYVTQPTAGAPSKQFNYEKPIGSELDSEAPGGTKFQTLNTNDGITYPTKEVSANNMMPFPIFTHTTIDCNTKKVSLHGYTYKESVVEVYKPDGLTPKAQTYDGEGKDYLFDFTDENIYSDVDAQDTNTGIKEYTNDDVKDLPYFDQVSGKVVLMSQAPIPIAPLDKVKAGVTMKGNSAHQFTVEIPALSSLVPGDIITAIATNYPPEDPLRPNQEIGSTSEFSPNFLIQPINSCRDLTIDKNHGAVNQDNNAAPATVDQIPMNVDQTYTMVVENKGPDANPITDIVIVEDTLDPQLKLVSAAGTPWTCTVVTATNKLKCVLIPVDSFIASGAKYPPISVVFQAITDSPNVVVPNTVTVRRINDTKQNRTIESIPGTSTFEKLFPNIIVSDPVDPTKPIAIDLFNVEMDLANNSAQEPVKIIPAPTVKIRKKVTTTPNEYKVGSTLSYDVIVTVAPNASFTEVTMKDDCGGGALENCVITTTQGTYDQATGMTTALTIPANGEIKYTVTGKVKVGTTGDVTNTATVTPPPGGTCIPDPLATNSKKNTNNCDDDTITPPAAPDKLSIVKKWDGTAPVDYVAGTDLNFIISIKNEGTSDVKTFNLKDDAFAGQAEAMNCGTIFTTFAGQDITLALALKPGEKTEFKCTSKAKATAVGKLTNTATLGPIPNQNLGIVAPSTPDKQSDGDVSNPLETSRDSIFINSKVINPEVSIRKIITTTPNQYTIGATLNYDIVVTVSPSTVFKQVKMIDDCGAGQLENCVVTTTQGTYDAVTGMTTALTIPANGEILYKVTGKVKSTATGNVKNSAKVDKTITPDPSNPNLPLPVCIQDAKATNASGNSELCDDDTTTPPVPTISIRKIITTTPNQYSIGDTLNYDVIVTVSPTTAYKQVKMIDDCGAGMLENCVVTTTQGTYDQATGMTTGLTILANGEILYKVTGKVKATATDSVKNTAKVDKTTPPDPANPNNPLPVCVADPKATNSTGNQDPCDDDTITPPVPTISIRKVITLNPNEYKRGDRITYNVIVTVTPKSVFKQIKMLDDCGAGQLENCVVTTTQGNYDKVTGMLTNVTFGADNSIVFNVSGTAKATSKGDIVNTAKVDPKIPTDPNVPNGPLPVCVADPKATNSSKNTDLCDDDTVTPPKPVIAIRKVITTSPNQYKPGDTLTYDIVVTNANPAVNILQIKMTDDCGAGQLEDCQIVTADGSYDKATGILTNIKWMEEKVKFMVTGKVKASATSVVVNTAKIDPSLPVDPKNPNNPKATCVPDALATNATLNKDICDDDTITPPIPPVPVTPRTGAQSQGLYAILFIVAIAFMMTNKINKKNLK